MKISYHDLSYINDKNYQTISEKVSTGDQVFGFQYDPKKEEPYGVYMPNLDYSGLALAEKLSKELNQKLFCVPITHAVMDITMQMQYAGLEVNEQTIHCIEEGVRDLIISTLNEQE